MSQPNENIVVLTAGHSGSSVLCSLIARQGCWLGDEPSSMHRDYRTFENPELVRLNGEILRESGYQWENIADIPPPSVERIRELVNTMDLTPYKAFLNECDDHQPWLWKNPRLCYTIHFWGQLADLSSCRFIILRREPLQAWTGTILKTMYMLPYGALRTIERNAFDSIRLFIEQYAPSVLEVLFEDLIVRPDSTIRQLNDFLGASLTVEQFDAIYRGSLYRKRWNKRQQLKAMLKYTTVRHLFGKRIRFPRAADAPTWRWLAAKKVASSLGIDAGTK